MSSHYSQILIIINFWKNVMFKTYWHQQHGKREAVKPWLVASVFSKHECSIKSRVRRTLPPLSPCIFNSSIFRKSIPNKICEKTAFGQKMSSSNRHVWRHCLAKTLYKKSSTQRPMCEMSKVSRLDHDAESWLCLVSSSILERTYKTHLLCSVLLFQYLQYQNGKKTKRKTHNSMEWRRGTDIQKQLVLL